MDAAGHSKVDIRKTHPGLYHALMVGAFLFVALGVNFWCSVPTFNPYGIPKNIIGAIFFGLGFFKLIFLNVRPDLRRVRFTSAVAVGWCFFWGIANSQQFFAGNASLQLPLLYVAISLFHLPLLIESPVNPMTKKARS